MTAGGAERALMRLREMFEQAPGAKALLRGPSHVFEMVNPAYSQLIGHRDVVNKPVAEALPEVVEQGFIALLDRVYRSGEAHVGRSVPISLLRAPQGGLEERVLDFVCQPLKDAAGQVTRIFFDATDVTDRVRAEEALRDADRRKDEFLATLAHELRNPLAPIRNAVHLLKLSKSSDLQVRMAGDIIDRQVHHLVRLVDDLLDVSRITLGQINLRHETFSLGGALTDAIETTRPLIEAAELGLVAHLPSENMELEGDPIRVSQVFQNILNNAAKYTPKGGRITIRVERHASNALVSIQDTGIGIPEELQPRIFDLFTRVHPSNEIKTSGLGIGLALAKQLVELHGGHIEVRSEGIGAGSEFVIRLPLLKSPIPSEEPPMSDSSTSVGAGDRRVLVVDDNRDSAESLAMLLQLSGCAVDVAFDGAAALGSLERFQPEIILLDIGMPGMDGYETARRIRSNPRGKNVLLVALTGWGQEEDKRRAAEAGFDEHLTKPVDPGLLGTLLDVDRSPAG